MKPLDRWKAALLLGALALWAIGYRMRIEWMFFVALAMIAIAFLLRFAKRRGTS